MLGLFGDLRLQTQGANAKPATALEGKSKNMKHKICRLSCFFLTLSHFLFQQTFLGVSFQLAKIQLNTLTCIFTFV